MQVKSPNCLIKNLTEMDSLPHLRNPTEISVLIDGMEDKGEVDDERKKVGCEGDGGAFSAAVINKAQVWVSEALKDIRVRLPFALLGIDSDNGSDFINNHLLRYCQQEKIAFTRGRARKKNDGCFVQKKLFSGAPSGGSRTLRFGDATAAVKHALRPAAAYTNYFQPVMKLVSKERIGAKVKKTYDAPQTPYRRLLAA